VHEAGHPQEIEKTEEEGRKSPVDLVKLAKIAISPVHPRAPNRGAKGASSFRKNLFTLEHPVSD
jgi:hypothetical protein